MKTLSDTIIISLALGLTVIAIHQAVTVGIGKSYWLFMFAIFLYLLYGYRKLNKS